MHSIIIAHRDRNEHLALCLRSLRLSASFAGIPKARWEVVVVDGGSSERPQNTSNVSVITSGADTPFNKSKLLNIGIEAAAGDVLTILDADAIVAPYFMWGVEHISPSCSKLAYRVRKVPRSVVDTHLASDSGWAALFQAKEWERWPIGPEGHGWPHRLSPTDKKRLPVFGNSQCSIPRCVLGDLRFDEHYVGRGFEDIDFNLRLWAQEGDRYRARLVAEPAQAMYHIDHPQFCNKSHWGEQSYNARNTQRYRQRLAKLKPTLAKLQKQHA